jgi:phosphonate transport system permease protein
MASASRATSDRAHTENSRSIRTWIVAAAIVALLALSWRWAEVRPAILFDGEAWRAAMQLVRGMFPIDVSPEFLRVVARALARTLALAIVGTLLSFVLAVPFGVLGTATLWRRGPLIDAEPKGAFHAFTSAVSLLSRAILSALRAVPDLTWGLLFVVAVGLGPLAGALALAVSYAGVLGRVYADTLEEVPPAPIESLYSVGASRTQIVVRAMIPQSRNALVAYSLYSFECCVRAASVLGFIGAGGIGQEIALSMRLFEYGQVLTLILAYLVLVGATDGFSRFLRRRLGANAPLGSLAHQNIARDGVARRRAWPIAAAALVFIVASFVESGFVDGRLFDPRLFSRVVRFVTDSLPPDFDATFLRALVVPLLQTIGISVIGTIIGVVIGAALAIPASSTIMLPSEESARRIGVGERVARTLTHRVARTLLGLFRSLPELVWVLLCVVAVGIGPFAGTLAIGVHTGGVLGKLYADTIEEVPIAPVDALRGTGAGPLQVALFAVWPQARPMLVSYTVLRWEMNLRASTILGLVGGGGLGTVIYNDVQLGFHQRVATLCLVVLAMVLVTEWIGDRMRVATSASPRRRKRLPVA